MLRPREVVTEAVRNLGPRHWIVFSSIALTSAILVYITAQVAWAALGAEQARRDAGGLVVVAESAGAGHLSVQDCERLNGLAGVGAAGGVYAEDPPVLAALRVRGTAPTLGVTVHAVDVWDESANGVTVVAGDDISDVLGLSAGVTLHVGATGEVPTLTVGSVLRPGVPVESLRSRVSVVIMNDEPLSTCWVRARPGFESIVQSVTAMELAGKPVVVTRFHPDPPDAPNPAALWESYTAKSPSILGGVAIALVALGVSWSRRSEFAVYRTFGVRRHDTAIMVFAETLIIAMPALALGAAWGLVAQAMVSGMGMTSDIAWVSARFVTASGAIALALAPLGALISMRGNVLEQLKDR